MKPLTNIKLPHEFSVDGGIEVLSSDITFDKEPYTGKLDNAHFNSKIRTTCIIDGVAIQFESNISHKLTDDELNELMIRLKMKEL